MRLWRLISISFKRTWRRFRSSSSKFWWHFSVLFKFFLKKILNLIIEIRIETFLRNTNIWITKKIKWRKAFCSNTIGDTWSEGAQNKTITEVFFIHFTLQGYNLFGKLKIITCLFKRDNEALEALVKHKASNESTNSHQIQSLQKTVTESEQKRQELAEIITS